MNSSKFDANATHLPFIIILYLTFSWFRFTMAFNGVKSPQPPKLVNLNLKALKVFGFV
jgi:hypothetical protein